MPAICRSCTGAAPHHCPRRQVCSLQESMPFRCRPQLTPKRFPEATEPPVDPSGRSAANSPSFRARWISAETTNSGKASRRSLDQASQRQTVSQSSEYTAQTVPSNSERCTSAETRMALLCVCWWLQGNPSHHQHTATLELGVRTPSVLSRGLKR